MPAWSVRLIRGALVYLVAGAMIGAMLLSATARGVTVPVGPARALHAELLLFGWLVQFTMGVAYWMLPKHATGPGRGPVGPIVAAWLLLNAGVQPSAVSHAEWARMLLRGLDLLEPATRVGDQASIGREVAALAPRLVRGAGLAPRGPTRPWRR